MKVRALIELLLDMPMHHNVEIDIDGWDCELVDVTPQGHGGLTLDADSPEGYSLRPDEPTAEMLDACECLGYTADAMRLMYATMMRADNEANEA